jgi:predicted TIM-barrel fold metal-dependent hydrolase
VSTTLPQVHKDLRTTLSPNHHLRHNVRLDLGAHAAFQPQPRKVNMSKSVIRAAIVSASFLFSAPAGAQKQAIVPLADHHQHIVGTAALTAIAQQHPLAPIKLPPELDRVIQAREAASGTTDIGIYTPDAQILDISEREDHWVKGAEGLKRMIEAYQPETPFHPTAYHVDGSSGYIAGVLGLRPASPTMHFMFGLRKDGAGQWRIAVEYATIKPPLEFQRPLTADKTIQVLDDAGIRKAAVLSVAYWLGDGVNRGSMAEEHAKVREENDWMVSEIGRFPDRLVGFCGVNPVRDYALEEVRRCAKLPGIKGVKVHFGNADIDVTKADNVRKLQRFFREANTNGMAIIAHLWIADRSYGARHARIFLDSILPHAPDVTVQIAHLGGAGRYVYDSVTQVFVDAARSGNPNMKNVYFDLATVVTETQSKETIDLITRRLRELGLSRILFGADTPTGSRADPIAAWATIRRRLTLTEDELKLIAENVAPYMR